jgi:hypothetical protein
MEISSAEISFSSDPNDTEQTEFITSGEGDYVRTFRCSVDVRTPLHQASVNTEAIEDAIDNLDEGGTLRISVAQEQYKMFYRTGLDHVSDGSQEGVNNVDI